jgi:16S rRNA (cytosine967-C5)-methyltransferase
LKTPREVAVEALEKIEKGSYSNLALNQLMPSGLPSRDRGLITELVYGVTQNKLRLDYIISKFSKTKLRKMSSIVLTALRLGVYQIVFLDRVPDFAAVSETVEIIKKYKGQRIANFVNGVLRNITRNKDLISYPDPEKDPEAYISVFYSFPPWLVKRWVSLYGQSFAEELCRALNEKPRMCIRVNTLKTDKGELRQRLSDENILSEEGLLLEEALYIADVPVLSNLASFREGLFQPQDEGSMLVSRVAGVKPGEAVLDVAAAPGGKATHMAQLMSDCGRILAWDLHPHRVELIKETCRRLGITIVEAQPWDALKPDFAKYESFDKVVVDAPCSGLGVIRRKPDIKWTKAPEDISSLKMKQVEMLSCVSRYVKPGGTLIYSTCSIDPEEDEAVIQEFLLDNPEYTLDNLNPFLPKKLMADGGGAIKGYIKLFPHLHGVDGFFIARLKRATAQGDAI